MAILNNIKEKIKKLIEVVPKRVLFGSDYSGCSQEEHIQFVKNLELNIGVCQKWLDFGYSQCYTHTNSKQKGFDEE